MASSRGRTGYVPPHLRKEGAAPHAQGGRSLDDVAPGRLPIRVQHTPGAFSLEGCPDPVDSVEEGSGGNGTSTAVLTSPECPDQDMIRELLEWFHKAAEGDTAAVLLLPASLTKQERAAWHQLAEQMGLLSKSQGLGEDRHLTVRRHAAPAAPRAADAGDLHPLALKRRAKQIWDWCQQDGGGFWQVSQGEIADLLSSPAGLTPELQALVDRRLRAREVEAAVAEGREAAAAALLAAEPGLAWVRDDFTGGYPLHSAAFYGRAQVVRAILDAAGPTVLQQRDGQRDTPADLAARRGHAHIQALLCAAAGGGGGGGGAAATGGAAVAAPEPTAAVAAAAAAAAASSEGGEGAGGGAHAPLAPPGPGAVGFGRARGRALLPAGALGAAPGAAAVSAAAPGAAGASVDGGGDGAAAPKDGDAATNQELGGGDAAAPSACETPSEAGALAGAADAEAGDGGGAAAREAPVSAVEGAPAEAAPAAGGAGDESAAAAPGEGAAPRPGGGQGGGGGAAGRPFRGRGGAEGDVYCSLGSASDRQFTLYGRGGGGRGGRGAGGARGAWGRWGRHGGGGRTGRGRWAPRGGGPAAGAGQQQSGDGESSNRGGSTDENAPGS